MNNDAFHQQEQQRLGMRQAMSPENGWAQMQSQAASPECIARWQRSLSFSPVAEALTSFSALVKDWRFVGMSDSIRIMAFRLGLKLKMETQKGWFKELVTFTVSGGQSQVRQFQVWWDSI